MYFLTIKKNEMISKYKEVRERLKKHIEDANGEGSWREYYGSQLEADFIYFVEKEVKNRSEQLVCDCSQGKGADVDEDGIMKDKLRIQELERQLELAENASVYTKARIERLFQYYFDSTKAPLDGTLLAFILNNVC